MGFNKRGSGGSKKTYLGVFQNQLVLQYDKEEDLIKKVESLGLDIDKIEERKKTKGKNEGQLVYYYVIYDVEGMITDVSINEADWGDMVEIELTDVDEVFVVALGDVFNRTTKDFIRRVGNLDVTEYVNFGLWSLLTDEGKSRSGVKMYQDNGDKVEYAITYDDMPEPIQRKKGRKIEWDYSEQETFLYDQLVEFIDENYKTGEVTEKAPAKVEAKEPAANAKKAPRKPRAKAEVADAKGIGPKDDMPF